MSLDTREKIVPLEQLAAQLDGGQWMAVAGTFDPMTLAQAERLAKLSGNGRSLLAVVEPGEGCLLPVEARAILVAALKSVQLVVIANADEVPPMEIARDDTGERRLSAEFVEHVRQRQGVK